MIETAKNAMKVIAWREVRRGATLQGFLKIELPSGMVISDFSYHTQDNGSRWISPPSKSFKNDRGEVEWQPFISFTTKDLKQKFLDQAIKALDEYLERESLEIGDADLPQPRR